MPTRATVGENIGTTVVDSFLTDIANKKSANKAEIKRILLYLHSILKNHFGVMLEWLKRHAWKACNRQNRFGGSNPPHSASIGRHYDGRYFFYLQAGSVSSPIRFREQEKTLREVRFRRVAGKTSLKNSCFPLSLLWLFVSLLTIQVNRL